MTQDAKNDEMQVSDESMEKSLNNQVASTETAGRISFLEQNLIKLQQRFALLATTVCVMLVLSVCAGAAAYLPSGLSADLEDIKQQLRGEKSISGLKIAGPQGLEIVNSDDKLVGMFKPYADGDPKRKGHGAGLALYNPYWNSRYNNIEIYMTPEAASMSMSSPAGLYYHRAYRTSETNPDGDWHIEYSKSR